MTINEDKLISKLAKQDRMITLLLYILDISIQGNVVVSRRNKISITLEDQYTSDVVQEYLSEATIQR